MVAYDKRNKFRSRNQALHNAIWQIKLNIKNKALRGNAVVNRTQPLTIFAKKFYLRSLTVF